MELGVFVIAWLVLFALMFGGLLQGWMLVLVVIGGVIWALTNPFTGRRGDG